MIFALRRQPAVGEQRGRRGADRGDPLVAFALAHEPLADERAFAEVFRALRAAGQDDDLELARGCDIGQMNIGQMPRLPRRRDRIRGQPRHNRLDFRAAQDVDDRDPSISSKPGARKTSALMPCGASTSARPSAGRWWSMKWKPWRPRRESGCGAWRIPPCGRRGAAMSCAQSTGTSIHDLQPS